VLDCVASGTSWVDMGALGIDALVTAPQKGWSGPACAGIVMLSAKGVEAAKNNESTSYCCQLNKWLTVMEAYEGGGFMYFTTLPTDALTTFRNAIKETEAMGLEKAREQGKTLGEKVRAVLESRGFKSVAAEGVKSTSVIVSYATKPDLVARFKAEGLQIAGGVPFKIDEPEGLMTFRVGLFGLDKVGEKLDDTVARFTKALDGVVKSME
jgi:aspartate aminotransferase-like enzyme